MDLSSPSVTCVCITKHRYSYLKRTIEMFRMQTYQEKKLLIVCDFDDFESIEIANNSEADLFVIPQGLNPTLGQIRSIAKSLLTTEYFCQWDDDDWFHSQRLEFQMRQLMQFGQKGCILTNWIIYDETSGISYLSMHRLWEGSAIYNVECAKAIEFPNLGLGEDTVFLNEYVKAHGIMPVAMPNLYIYRIHGNNSWGGKQNHFKMMLSQAQKLPSFVSKTIHNLIDSHDGYIELCSNLIDKKILETFHFFKFNNLNYTNEQLLQYMTNIEIFDEDRFNVLCLS
jgi:glycosyltransferase involved in cell wall biosynthesis